MEEGAIFIRTTAAFHLLSWFIRARLTSQIDKRLERYKGEDPFCAVEETSYFLIFPRYLHR